MKLGGKNTFDLSDVEAPQIDTLDDVIKVAASVLEDYGDKQGGTRIERMARWLVYNVGLFDMGPGDPVPAVGRDFSNASIRLVSLDTRHVRSYLPDQARVLAAMLLREAEYAEAE